MKLFTKLFTAKEEKMEKVRGYYMALTDNSAGRVVFSAVIPDLDEQTFVEMWKQVGTFLHRKLSTDPAQSYNQYSIRVDPVTN